MSRTGRGDAGSANKADNVLDVIHHRPCEGARSIRTAAQNGVNIGGILFEPPHFDADGSEPGHGEIDQCIFEAGKLRLVEADEAICEEVSVKIFEGHTVGQLVPYIFAPQGTIVYVGDVIPVMASLPLSWVSAYDNFPLTSMEDKEILLSEAVAKNQILFFEHDAYTECCRVESVNGKYRVKESFTLSSIV